MWAETFSVLGHDVMCTKAFGVVLFAILVQGITIEPLEERLGLLGETRAS